MSRSCTTTHSYSPAPPPPPVTADRIVETELEAAEILASLSKSTPPPSSREASIGAGAGAGESVDSWGSRSKRSNTVRLKSESSPVDSALNSASATVVEEDPEMKPVLLAFDLNEDQAATLNQEEECQREPKDVVKDEDAELVEPSPACTISRTGGKSRQNLTEAEKEARRLRRVLANRESARQTIRRRQASYEELIRKVADLVRDNENLKKEKESAVKDFDALRSTNKNLNEQVTEQLGFKLEENVGKSTSVNCSVPPFPFPNYPYIICKDTPFVCPYNAQLPDMNPSQPGHFSFPNQSEAKLSETSYTESPNAHGNPLSNSGPSGHWCMLPYPLFFPIPDAKNGPNLIPFFPSGDKEDEAGVADCPKNLPSEYPIDVKTEFPTSVEAQVGKDSHEIPFGLSMDVVDQQIRFQSNGVVDNADASEAMGLKLTNAANSEAISSKGVDDVKVIQESHQEPGLKNGKRLVDPAVAAKARKRRKELTRLKSLHCRSHRKEGLRLGESHPSLSRNA